MDPLTTIRQALDDFARDTKPEVTLDASGYDASERPLAQLGGLSHRDFRELGDRSRVLRGL
jgi:hypothetical protein